MVEIIVRPWPEGLKKTLRHLAAARFFLPVKLNQGDFPETESQFIEYLHHAEYGLAFEMLEVLGEMNRGHAEEQLFWTELLLAAENMNLFEQVQKCRERLVECTRNEKLA